MAEETLSEMGLYGLAVMGQNFALNVAEKGFTISVCNRSPAKVDTCMARAQQELGDDAGNMRGFKDKAEFVASLKKPRRIMFLVKQAQLLTRRSSSSRSSWKKEIFLSTVVTNGIKTPSVVQRSWNRRELSI